MTPFPLRLPGRLMVVAFAASGLVGGLAFGQVVVDARQ
jgi:hypothetical protein